MSDIFGSNTGQGADPLMAMVMSFVFNSVASAIEAPTEDESDDYNRARKDAGKIVRDIFNESLAEADGDDGVPKLGRHPASI